MTSVPAGSITDPRVFGTHDGVRFPRNMVEVDRQSMTAARGWRHSDAPENQPGIASVEDVEMRSPRFALSLCLVAAYGWGAAVHAEDLTPASVWMTSFTKAQAEAKRLHRPMVVHFHTTTCPPCRKMEKEVLHTPQILKLLDSGFVAVKVDMNDASNAKVVAKYRIDAMPTDIVLSQDGTVLHRTTGYNPGPAGDRPKYIAALTQIDTKYAAEGKRLNRSAPALVPAGVPAGERAAVVAPCAGR